MTTEDRAVALLSQMTLSEKVAQLLQYNGSTTDNLEEKVAAGIGSILNLHPVSRVNQIQRIAVEQTRLGIPLIVGRDVIHGHRTVYPVPLGLSCSWDEQLAEQTSRAAAVEAAAEGFQWTFAPMLDICRDARWGRIAESFGEDAFLAGRLGAAAVRGFQTDDLSSPDAIAACCKHFAGYGLAEGGRDYNAAEVSQRTFGDSILRAFREPIAAGAATVMPSFNEVGGIAATANKQLLTDTLCDAWGFDGFAVSDWNAVAELIDHGLAEDEAHAAALAIQAGTHMDMTASCYGRLEQLVNDGAVPIEVIDEAVGRILRIKFRLGLFEKPYTDESTRETVSLCSAHTDLARRAAAASAVLLRNPDDILPLSDGKTALLGPLADGGRAQMGCWAFDGKAENSVTIAAAMRQQLGENLLEYGLDVPATESTDCGQAMADVLGQAQRAVVVVGEPANFSGEACCRAHLDLPGNQRELIETVVASGTPTVVVLMAGRPLALPWLYQLDAAVLLAFHPGTMAGPGLADVLLGQSEPTGRLSVTIPRDVGQIPIYYNHRMTGRPAVNEEIGVPETEPVISVGNVSRYFDVSHLPQWPFGYGLGYTKFEYANLQLSCETIEELTAEPIVAHARLTNVGDRAGQEIVQLYLRDPAASAARPVRELIDFQAITLEPGQSAQVEFTLNLDALAFTALDMRRCIEPGRFELYVGPNSAEGLAGSFTYTGPLLERPM